MAAGLGSLPDRDILKAERDLDIAARIFKRAVRMVEIEVYSFCNRRCWFCPNSKIDRISNNVFMSASVYSKILDDLKSIAYSNMITFSRYNEPFADRVILNRIAEARAKLPGALLHSNTNGDYLDPEYLQLIYEAGLRSLNIQFYLKNDSTYSHDAVKRRSVQVINKLGLPYNIVRDDPDEWYEIAFAFRDMSIRAYGRIFAKNGTSRGQTVNIKRNYLRTSPCLVPTQSVFIDHNGSMMPCCNFVSDVPEHRDYIIGDLKARPSIFLEFMSDRAVSFRRSVLNGKPKTGLCADCQFALTDPTEADLAALDHLLAES